MENSPYHIAEASLADEIDGGGSASRQEDSPVANLLIPRVNLENKNPINSPVVVLKHRG